MLDLDSLRSVLVRVPAEDHNSLRLTCKTTQAIVNSTQFKRERNRLEWVETKATLVSPREQFEIEFPIQEDYQEPHERERFFLFRYNDLGYIYDGESYGCTDVWAKIWVDGKRAGSAKLTLVPRPRRCRFFHRAPASISSELHKVSVTFCDTRGRPRPKCIQQVATDHNKGFLHLNRLELDAEYQDFTFAGTQAIRSLLCDTLLHNRWSLVGYIADSQVHFNDDDRGKARKKEMRDLDAECGINLGDQADADEDENLALQDWSSRRCDELAQKDTRQFFRAGFQQVAESVHDSDLYYMFAVPSFMEGCRVRMSHIEALALPIATRPAKPVESLQGVNRELHELMERQCSERTEKAKLFLTASEEEKKKESIISVSLKDILQSFQGAQSDYERRVEEAETASRRLKDETEATLHMISEGLNPSAALLQDLSTSREQAINSCVKAREVQQKLEVDIHDAVAKMRVEIQGLDLNEVTLRELGDVDVDTRVQVKLLVEEKGASVQASNALHCCAVTYTLEYIDLLLEYIPEHEKVKTIINSLDVHFQTPLMVCAAGTESGAAKLRTCEKLVALGANKSITDHSGRSALGYFRLSRRNAVDALGSLGLYGEDKDAATSAELERLLMPLTGETEADKAMQLSAVDDDG